MSSNAYCLNFKVENYIIIESRTEQQIFKTFSPQKKKAYCKAV